MPEFKIVVSDPKTGLAKQFKVSGQQAQSLIGLKIGDIIDGSIVGLEGVKLKITGGSDFAGFPMHPSIHGGGKKRVLLSGPPGFHPTEKGERRRKIVRGNTITEDIVQINTVIVYEREDQGPYILPDKPELELKLLRMRLRTLIRKFRRGKIDRETYLKLKEQYKKRIKELVAKVGEKKKAEAG